MSPLGFVKLLKLKHDLGFALEKPSRAFTKMQKVLFSQMEFGLHSSKARCHFTGLGQAAGWPVILKERPSYVILASQYKRYRLAHPPRTCLCNSWQLVPNSPAIKPTFFCLYMILFVLLCSNPCLRAGLAIYPQTEQLEGFAPTCRPDPPSSLP